jgi:hypothetical protein
MTTLKKAVKKTGYKDIDEMLVNTHNLLQEVDQIQKEIAEALSYKPLDPFKKSRPKFRIKKTVKI